MATRRFETRHIRTQGGASGFNPVRARTAERAHEIPRINRGRVNDIHRAYNRQRTEVRNARNDYARGTRQTYDNVMNGLRKHRGDRHSRINTRYNGYRTDINLRYRRETGIDQSTGKPITHVITGKKVLGEIPKKNQRERRRELRGIRQRRTEMKDNYRKQVGYTDKTGKKVLGEVQKDIRRERGQELRGIGQRRYKAFERHRQQVGYTRTDKATGNKVQVLGEVQKDIQHQRVNEQLDIRKRHRQQVGYTDKTGKKFQGEIQKGIQHQRDQELHDISEHHRKQVGYTDKTGKKFQGEIQKGIQHQRDQELRDISEHHRKRVGYTDKTGKKFQGEIKKGIQRERAQEKLAIRERSKKATENRNNRVSRAEKLYKEEKQRIIKQRAERIKTLDEQHEKMVGKGSSPTGGRIEHDYSRLPSKPPFLDREMSAKRSADSSYHQGQAQIIKEAKEGLAKAYNAKESEVSKAKTQLEHDRQGFKAETQAVQAKYADRERTEVATANTQYREALRTVQAKYADKERVEVATAKTKYQEALQAVQAKYADRERTEVATAKTKYQEALLGFQKEMQQVQAKYADKERVEVNRATAQYQSDMLRLRAEVQEAHLEYEKNMQRDMDRADVEREDDLKKNEQERQRELNDVDKFFDEAALRAYEVLQGKEADADKQHANALSQLETKRSEALLQNESNMLNLQNRVLESFDKIELHQWEFQRHMALVLMGSLAQAITSPMAGASHAASFAGHM